MAIDFARSVYSPAFAVFARTVTFTPKKSQPGQPSYTGRGIFSTQEQDVLTEAGVVFSDQHTILDILEIEFTILPIQGDTISIPTEGAIPAAGDFEIIDADTNGGGETTLTLRKIVTAKP